jgi:hypothetical protein
MPFFNSFYWLALLACVSSVGCQSPTTAIQSSMSAIQTDRFRLHATPGCADGYPAEIDEARFIGSDGSSFPVPYGHFLVGNWGRGGTLWAVGDDRQPAPDSLEIRWFSYTENKFYEGHFLLPQGRIHALLKQGYWQAETKKQETYDELNVTVVPTGVVVVWLVGASNQVLIGRYQAQPINYDYAVFAPKADRAAVIREEQAKLTPEVRHQIAMGTISSKKWDDYLRTYPWKIGFSRPLTLTNFSIGYLNAEQLDAPPTPDLAAFTQTLLARSPKPVPKGLSLDVSAAYGRQRELNLTFPDEHETMHAFQTLHAQHPQEPFTLFVDVDEQLSKATLSLRAGNQIVPLPKTKIKFWPVK